MEKKPLTRFGEFELLKAMAIIGLPLVHVMEEMIEEGFASSGLQTFGYGIVGLCAFVFFLWNYKIDVLKVLVSPNNEYITDLPNVLMLLALACFLLGIVYYLCKVIGHTGFINHLYVCGNKVWHEDYENPGQIYQFKEKT